MIQYRQPPAVTAYGVSKELPETKPYEYNGSGHDEISPEECCAECMRTVRNLKRAREGK